MQVNVCMRFHTSFFCEVLVDSNLPCRVKHGTQPLAASRSANKALPNWLKTWALNLTKQVQ